MVREPLQAQLRINLVRIAFHLRRGYRFPVHALEPLTGDHELLQNARNHERHVAVDWLSVHLCLGEDFPSDSVSGWILLDRL